MIAARSVGAVRRLLQRGWRQRTVLIMGFARVGGRSMTDKPKSSVSSMPGPLLDLVAIFSTKEEDDGRRELKFTFASSSFMVRALTSHPPLSIP